VKKIRNPRLRRMLRRNLRIRMRNKMRFRRAARRSTRAIKRLRLRRKVRRGIRRGYGWKRVFRGIRDKKLRRRIRFKCRRAIRKVSTPSTCALCSQYARTCGRLLSKSTPIHFRRTFRSGRRFCLKCKYKCKTNKYRMR
jgi:hypothetical protein